MADAKPVSLRLATRTRQALHVAVPGLKIGTLLAQLGGRRGVSETEDIDGPSDPPF